MDTVFTITDRLAMIYEKRVAFVGTPDEAKTQELKYLREFIKGGKGTLNEDL
jgi:ABC-type transporter Mla maintaining outer membrane lipid asymmetry ATPase subunit MlaF